MKEPSQPVVLIVGASSGIGLACARLLHERGSRVYGASRRILAESHAFHALVMDVESEESVATAVEQVLEREGRVDVLLNCAGYVLAGAIEETSLEEARAQFDTNFFGAVRTMRAVLPAMRRQRAGMIINVGSIAGLIPMPFQAFYSASKAALTAVADALALEVVGFGIEIIHVHPGDYRTAITANRRRARKLGQVDDYRARGERALQIMENDERAAAEPDAIARRVLGLVTRRGGPRSILIGPFIQRLAVLLRVLFPRRFFDWALGKYYRL